MIFGSGTSSGPTAAAAAREAMSQAHRPFAGETPKLAVVFTSVAYEDNDAISATIRELVGDIPIIGGTAGGCVIGPTGVFKRAVSIMLLGGNDVAVRTRSVRVGEPSLADVVPAAREIAEAADDAARSGLEHYACLVFAPALEVDGEALVAAVRKGAGARAQLAGGLAGDDFTFDRARVLDRTGEHSDRVVLAGVYTSKPIGIAARHGWRPLGPARVVTRSEGDIIFELDHRPALDVWHEDARRSGSVPPNLPLKQLGMYLANHHNLGIADPAPRNSSDGELVVRAPTGVFENGSVRISGSIGEGTRVHVMETSRKDLLRAATNAAADAVMRARSKVAGAIVLSCAARLTVLGDEFHQEAAFIRERIGAPIGGACVLGEIAKSERDYDAFFNTTVVVVAFAS